MRRDSKRAIVEEIGRSKGVFRAAEAREKGISASYLRYLASTGHLERTRRGLFALRGAPLTEHHDLVEVAACVPASVVCLLSALQFHGIGTQMPPLVWIAVPSFRRPPTTLAGSVRPVHMSAASFSAGVETHVLEGVPVRVFNVAKTIADCFKFRSLVGLDVAVEALRSSLADHRVIPAEIYEYAKIDRVWKVMEPYLEALQ